MVSYGALALTVSSPQLYPQEPISIEEAKVLAKVEHNEEDELLDDYITTARVAAENETGINLAVKQFDLTLDYFPGCAIELPGPLQSVDLVRTRDSDGSYTTLVEDTDYIVDRARALVLPPYGSGWPSFTPYPSGAILIRFQSGYPASHPFWSGEGKAIMTGMKFLITDWYYNRDVTAAKGGAELPYRVKYLFGLIAKQRAR
jgi:uncharacterized phiE125 gp8 family phage protein